MLFHRPHALLEDRVPPGLADDQISPLDNDNAGKECRMARELDDLSLLISLHTQTGSKMKTRNVERLRVNVIALTHCCP